MRAFSEAKDEAVPGGDADNGEDSSGRIVALKSASARAPAGEGLGEKRRREDVSGNGDAEDVRKRGVRGRGAATFQSSVVAAVHEGPRRDPPQADPTRVLKIEGLKRPFTDKQLRDALQGSDGKGRRDITWFWLNRIKSVCFVEFDSEREADAARTDLYDLTWPETSHSPGRLLISFTSRDAANRTVAEEPVGALSARLGHIPGVGGLPGVGGVQDGGRMRGWGSLADASGAARGEKGERGNSARGMPVNSRLGPVGGVAGFGVAGKDMGAGTRSGGRGWGSLAAGPREGNAMGDRGRDRMPGQAGARDTASRGAREAAAPVRLEDLFKKTKAKPEIFWQQNPAQIRERVLKKLRETGAPQRDAPGGSTAGSSRGPR